MKAMLIDSTRCIGCRACQVSCKEWNERKAEPTTFFAGKGYQNPVDLSAETWTLITYNEVEYQGRFEWVFGKKQCFHCNVPGCATACPVAALIKLDSGPVIYDAGICLGCRYCQLACPFKVPRFEWHSAIPEITKCTMCADRVEAGLEPACVKVCPTDAIVFGEREELIRDAENRIRTNPRGYVHHIYGKDEAGGTCVMHLSNVPFEQIGFDTAIPEYALADNVAPAMKPIPYVISGLGIVLGATSWIVHRRMERKEAAKDEGGDA
jgi:formate dehydrogenase iron-sulfur subunit